MVFADAGCSPPTEIIENVDVVGSAEMIIALTRMTIPINAVRTRHWLFRSRMQNDRLQL